MKKFVFGVLALTLAGCATTRQLPDNANPALMLGEAAYFTTRCPKLKQERLKDALVVTCLLNKAAGIDCPTMMKRRLVTDLLRGAAKAEQEFKSVPAAKVCRAAIERYGRNGSHFKNMLVPK
jgi:hypothetical protein